MRPVFLLIAAACLGIALDFVCNGVVKIGSLYIDVPVYLAVASTIGTAFSNAGWGRLPRVVIAFLGGTLAGHLLLSGRVQTRVYAMTVALPAPLTLRSSQWPQELIVTSEKLSAELARRGAEKEFPVVVSLLTDYGCIRSFFVESVAGVDVRFDPEASWVWKVTPGADPPTSGPGEEDRVWPWCRAKVGWDWLLG